MLVFHACARVPRVRDACYRVAAETASSDYVSTLGFRCLEDSDLVAIVAATNVLAPCNFLATL